MFSFGKLVSFALILFGLWSLFRVLGRLDQARRGKPAHREQARRAPGSSRQARSKGQANPNMVQAKTLVQCPNCQLYHEANKPCPDCNPR